ncbi:MAG: TRAP transporter substrate-binding protein [Vallitaleaceae bacterium]|nr:TRAP transporter substrate-binding protein [Vallitaleaceae bacterium]
MKKMLVVLLVVTIVFGMVGCGSQETNEGTNAEGSGNESVVTETETEATSDEKYVLRMAIVTSQNHTHNQSILNWAEQVKEETDGRLEIMLLDSGTLGGERDYIEGMKLGTIDMAQVSSAVVANFLPNFSVMSLPYVFDSYESIGDIVNGEIGTALFEDLESINIVGLTWFSNGFRSVFTNVENVTKPEDLKGVKIRVMESAVMIDTLNAMGASATPMAYSELYTAIQQGVLDGGENAPGNILNDKFYEISKQLSLTEHFATPGVVAISQKAFDKLPADLQEYLKESAQELGAAEQELDKINQLKAVEELIENGVVVTEVDKDAFKEAVLPLYSTATKDIDPRIVELLKETLNIEF